jgi:hypothetical protein
MHAGMTDSVSLVLSAGGVDGGFSNPPDPSSVLITQITLANTLLSDAVESLRARFISDCAKYLQVRVLLKPTAVNKCCVCPECL